MAYTRTQCKFLVKKLTLEKEAQVAHEGRSMPLLSVNAIPSQYEEAAAQGVVGSSWHTKDDVTIRWRVRQQMYAFFSSVYFSCAPF